MAPQSSGPSGSAKSPKQLAAEARAASEAAERRRERMIRIVGSIAVLVIVGGLIAIGFLAGRDDEGSGSVAAPTPDPSAASPAGVSSDTFGVPYGAGWDSPDESKLPTLELWEDFQCPACAQVEAVAGDGIKQLAEDGKVKLLFRPAIFLDRGLAQDNVANGNPNSSARAASAFGCAVDAGRTGEYHAGLFDIQPADEGVGFSDQALIDLGGTVGIAGDDLTTFTTCVQEGRYLSWAANSQVKFDEAGVGGTPTGYLNGVELNSSQLADVAGLAKLIEDATAS
jgi:protein-disulfide isomerase